MNYFYSITAFSSTKNNYLNNVVKYNRARNIAQDSLHPGHHLFNLLPSGRRYRCIKTRTNRLKNFSEKDVPNIMEGSGYTAIK